MITVLTPTYNRKHTLINAYQSLLKQTNKDFELNKEECKLIHLYIGEGRCKTCQNYNAASDGMY